jgi:hypothetical protein
MPTAAQPLRGLPEPQKMEHRLLTVRTKNKMASVGSSRNSCMTIGISQLDMPTEFARYATVGEVDAESWQNPPDLENQFLYRWICYCTDCRFKMADF